MAPKAIADVDSIKCPAEAPPENETLYLKNGNGTGFSECGVESDFKETFETPR